MIMVLITTCLLSAYLMAICVEMRMIPLHSIFGNSVTGANESLIKMIL